MRKGFGLIEVSIVLVIVALLAGGVLVGRDLMRSAEVRSVKAEAEKISTAINLFRTKIGGLPGDTARASRYISGAVNGDGDGTIDYANGLYSEEHEVWPQLAAAGFIKGTYTGATDSLYPSGIASGFFRVSYQTSVYGKELHLISLNGLPAGETVAKGPILSPDEVYSMDLKFDDGAADSGDVMGFNEQAVPGCVTNYHTAGSGDYVVPSSDVTCKVFFRM